MALSLAIVIQLMSEPSMSIEQIWRMAIVFGLVGCYPQTLVLGVPAYFVLREHFDPNLSNCALVGAIVATVPWMVLMLVNTVDDAFGWLHNSQIIGVFVLAGAIGGALFWAIAATGSGAGPLPSIIQTAESDGG